MRFSPTETAAPERDSTRDQSSVRPVEPDPTPRVPASIPFSPADKLIVVARGILEDELVPAASIVSAH